MQGSRVISLIIIGCLALFFPDSAHARKEPSVEQLKAQMDELRKQMDMQRQVYESQMKDLQGKIDALSEEVAGTGARTTGRETEAPIGRAGTEGAGTDGGWSSIGKAVQSLNPEIAVIIDTFYHNSDADRRIREVFEGVQGFGHAQEGGSEHGHEHAQLDEGFNLREVELYLAGSVDPYFKAYTTLSFSEDGAEVEEAVAQTTSLPFGFQVQAGKFLSDFSRINSQHPHEWDFVDRPLMYELTLGDHGLLEKGIQISWLTPAPFYLLAGAEVLQGENELMFNHLDDERLPFENGPRLYVGWLKFSPALPFRHELLAGVSGGYGNHQEAHDGDADGAEDHWLDGHTYFMGANAVYKYDSGREHGHGDFTLQGEYFHRTKDLELKEHELAPQFVGNDRIDRQDGYYIQGVYGFLPRWRAGLRWEQIGIFNESELPSGLTEYLHNSRRVSAMVDFNPTEFSRIRLQGNHGHYLLDDGGDEDVWQVFLQLTIALGSHGAHSF